jgi:hypothetical protein
MENIDAREFSLLHVIIFTIRVSAQVLNKPKDYHRTVTVPTQYYSVINREPYYKENS